MTKEQITAAAEERYPIVFDENKQPFHVMVRNEQRQAFTSGAEWARKEMEKEACEFAEWISGCGFSFHSRHNVWVGLGIRYSSLEMLQKFREHKIFKQQKP